MAFVHKSVILGLVLPEVEGLLRVGGLPNDISSVMEAVSGGWDLFNLQTMVLLVLEDNLVEVAILFFFNFFDLKVLELFSKSLHFDCF